MCKVDGQLPEGPRPHAQRNSKNVQQHRQFMLQWKGKNVSIVNGHASIRQGWKKGFAPGLYPNLQQQCQ
jgi:hypothetical protein